MEYYDLKLCELIDMMLISEETAGESGADAAYVVNDLINAGYEKELVWSMYTLIRLCTNVLEMVVGDSETLLALMSVVAQVGVYEE